MDSEDLDFDSMECDSEINEYSFEAKPVSNILKGHTYNMRKASEDNSISSQPQKSISSLHIRTFPFSPKLSEIVANECYYLHFLVFKGEGELIAELLDSQPTNLREILSYEDHCGITPVMLAVRLCEQGTEYFEILKMLLSSGADARKKDRNGWGPLQEACYQKNPELLSTLFSCLYTRKREKLRELQKEMKAILKDLPDFSMEIA